MERAGALRPACDAATREGGKRRTEGQLHWLLPWHFRFLRHVLLPPRDLFLGAFSFTPIFVPSAALRPKVRSMVALAPVAYIYHMPVPLGLISPFAGFIEVS
ncbi:hypothetical protein E2C01_070104 [Portunus trituberculatus]|uniref:Uncharacterized protein n=1 Tax=Portunus trituberculatus TaxID=210409 RepID=A0A5B7HRU3_PORTR|nr:hypothetical protein [Portunus trituberculatus]